MDTGFKYYAVALMSPLGNKPYALKVTPDEILFIRADSIFGAIAALSFLASVIVCMILFELPGMIIGNIIGWTAFIIFKRKHQGEIEKRIKDIYQNPSLYTPKDNIEKLTLSDLKKVQIKRQLGNYMLGLNGYNFKELVFIIKDKKEFDEIKALFITNYSSKFEIQTA